MSGEGNGEIICPSCGLRNRAGANFCGFCGARIARPPSFAQPIFIRARATLTDAIDKSPSVPLFIEIVLVAALTLVALALRIYDLSGLPYGIHGDEVESALEARRVLQGADIGLWTPTTLGSPSGYIYWMSVIFRVAGIDIDTMRLASVIPGAAIVPAAYLLARSLFSFRVAILTAVLTNFFLWFLILSRIAFQGITSVLVAMLAMWLIVLAARYKRLWISVAGGLALGLGLYTFKQFVIYFFGLWGASILILILSKESHTRKAICLFLGVSVLAGLPMLWYYAENFSDIYATGRSLYGISLTSPSTWTRLPALILDTVLLVHNPIRGNTTEAAPAIPMLHIGAEIFFWVGMAVSALCITRRRYQLILVGWLIAMTPHLLTVGPDTTAEARRYLLGAFFVMLIVSIGLDAVLSLLTPRIERYLKKWEFSAQAARRIAYGAGFCIVVVFVSLFAFKNMQDFNLWKDSDELKWFFSQDHVNALQFIDSLDESYAIRYYSGRFHFDDNVRRFLLPDARGTNGSESLGGDGSVHSSGPVSEDTVFVFFEGYLHLARELEDAYPSALRIREYKDGDKTLYVAYLVEHS